MSRVPTRRPLLTALVLGVFAAVWLSWGGGEAPASWDVPLRVAGWLAVAVAVVAGVLLLRRGRTDNGPDPSTSRRYGRVVLVSYLVIAFGTVALLVAGLAEYVAPWVAFVVGAHFWALAPVLGDRLLVPLGLAVLVVAVVAAVGAGSTEADPTFLTGLGTGGVLLVGAGLELGRGSTSVQRPDRG